VGGGQEDIHETFKLEQDARIEVRGINGPVEISTAESETADVHVVSTANSEDDLEGQRVFIEHTPSSLVVRGEGGRHSFWNWLWGRGSVRQHVTLILPRRIQLLATGVNGPVTIGEVEGSVRVDGVNGRVEVAQAAGRCDVTGVNGSVKITSAQPGAQGLEVKGINGSVEIRLKDGANADVNVEGLNGSVAFNIPNVTQQRENPSNLRARIGTGGAPINIMGVNGGLRFESAGAGDNQ